MNKLNITNYDVLVSPPMPGKSDEYQLDKSKNHAGNNRLEVFLNMHRSSYDSARKLANFGECKNIVDKIVVTVCHQCVPKGRFLVSSINNNTAEIFWNQMDEQNAKLLLRSILCPIKPPSAQPSLEVKKRRRSSSLLRRSISESMVGAVIDSKKKLSKLHLGVTQEAPSWMSARAEGLTLRRMDVILTDHGKALDPNSQSVGNNRLHILIAINSSKYQQSSVEEEETILTEIIGTVKIWTGRFLVQGTNGYEELPKEDARNSLRSIFFLRSGQASIQHKRSSLRNPSVLPLPIKLMDKPAPAPKLSRKTSQSIIDAGPDVNMPELETLRLRLAAVNNLKKTKARQKIASRLEDKSGRSHTVAPVDNCASKPDCAQATTVGNKEKFSYADAVRMKDTALLQKQKIGMRSSKRQVMKRQSSTIDIGADLMKELAAGVEENDFNDKERLPPTQPNVFATRKSP